MLYQLKIIMTIPLESEMRVEETLLIPTTLIVSMNVYTKDETSETIVRNLFSPISCIQGSLQARNQISSFKS